MTADEIRNEPSCSGKSSLGNDPTPYMIQDLFFMLREIAAQLAELNQTLKSFGIGGGDELCVRTEGGKP